MGGLALSGWAIELLSTWRFSWPQRVKTPLGGVQFRRASSSKAKVSKDNSPLNQKILLNSDECSAKNVGKQKAFIKNGLSGWLRDTNWILNPDNVGVWHTESDYWGQVCLWAEEEQTGVGWGGLGAPGKATPSDHGRAGLEGTERGLLAAAIPGPHFHMVCWEQAGP